MNKCIRIVQISDCHLPADPAQDYRGEYAYKNLGLLLEKVRDFNPDALLASGDLSEDASPASYHALRTYFDVLKVPVLALPGNHDDAVMVAETFPGSPVDDVAVSEHGLWRIIRLNSCLANKPEGRLSEHSLEQLEQILAQETQRPCLVALHHQPVCVGSGWIDKYRLFDPQAFIHLVTQAPAVKAVVWGHVHHVFESNEGGAAMLGCPSSVINSISGVERFTADKTLGPACRWLELGLDGGIHTEIIHI